MKTTSLLCAVLSATGLFAATPTVSSVTAQQRYPWNGKVDILVTFAGASNDVATATCTFAATNTATATALAIAHVARTGNDSGSDNVWTRHYVWDATADVGEVKIADVVINVEATKPLGGVQLWKDGPYWAECNVGATKPEEYGYYFWWGDTVGYQREGGTWTDYYYSGVTWVSSTGTRMSSSPFNSSICPTYGKSIATLQSLGYIDSTGNLVAAHDAATAHLGAPWRMPTDAEMAALISNCTMTWITTNGVYGRLVTGKGDYASKSIFLPAVGYGDGSDLCSFGSYGNYWSSTPYSGDYSGGAWSLYFDSGYFDRGSNYRYSGQSVRSLREFALREFAECVMASTHLALDTRTGTRYAQAEEPIVFSTEWSTNVTRLVLSVDGANVLTTITATNGVYVWTPDFSVAKTVTLKHTTRGAENVSLTATFTTEEFDVTFDPGAHGSFVEGAATTQRIPHGSDAVPPEVTPDAGYTFTGWNGATTNITANVTNVAQYAATEYAITYENLSGAANPNPSTYTVADAITFVAPGSVARRQFLRWEPAAIEKGTMGAQTVTAVWETMPYVYVDAANGDDTRDGSTAELAVKTLARAYALAEAGDTIQVAAGTYDPVTATGKAVTFRATGGATIDGGGTERCVTADKDVVFENFTLQNGYDGSDTAAGGGASGGTFESCTITNCASAWDGGGAYGAILRNCLIIGNTAENGWGGGAYGCTLINCQVVNNLSGDEGGGVYAPEAIQDSTFRGNSPENVAGDDGKVTAGTSYVYEPFDSESAYSISYDWFVAKGLAKVGDATSGLDAKLEATHTNGRTGWESFVAGLDPTNATSEFTAMVTISNGQVCVSWSPNLNDGKASRIYTVYGRTELGTGDWETPANDGHKFFMVEVAMPEGDAASDVPGPLPKSLGGVQLWKDGPYWAECNVGATKPEEYGYYFWWGDTVGYQREGGTWTDYYYSGVTWVSSDGKRMGSSSFDSSTCPTYHKGIATLQSLGYVDSSGNLVAAHDAATAHLGAPWRMPTDAEMSALISNCTTTWIMTNGVYGCLVTGDGDYASKSIFLPAAGCGSESYLNHPGSYGGYWSSTPNSGYSYSAWCLYFSSSYFGRGYGSRCDGRSVRSLREFAK